MIWRAEEDRKGKWSLDSERVWLLSELTSAGTVGIPIKYAIRTPQGCCCQIGRYAFDFSRARRFRLSASQVNMAVATVPLSEDVPLSEVLKSLEIPRTFDNLGDTDTGEADQRDVAQLEWKRGAYVVLSDHKARLQNTEGLSVSEQGDVVSSIAPLALDRPWTTEAMRELAKGMYLQTYFPLRESEILITGLKTSLLATMSLVYLYSNTF